MSSVHAMEEICGVRVDGALRELRRLLYCGEWIESHVLHVYMLHAPDFLGYPSVLEMAKDLPDVVNRALRLKKIGNHVMEVLGGREIHPINVKVGGFYRAPTREELLGLVPDLEWALDAALATVRLVATFNFPHLERDYELVALRHPDEYPLCEGRIVSNRGLDISIQEYEGHFVEEHIVHSNALQSHRVGGGAYFVGPLARYALNFDKLSPKAREVALEVGLGDNCRNPFKSIIVRAVEVVFAIEESLRIIDVYQRPEKPCVEIVPRAGVGHGCTEAPRGLLYHRYRLDEQGFIEQAKITPPTSQNQKTIEEDLFEFVESHMDLDDEELKLRCEQAIRNYDPCISCATHFLDLKVERT